MNNTDAMLTNYIQVLNANMPPHNNPDAVANLFTENGVHSEPSGDSQRGRQAIRDRFAKFEKLFADWTHIEKSRTIQGNRAVWEAVAQGTDKETGQFVTLPVVFFIEFDNQGKVQENRVYYDTHAVAEQLK
jgi:ketosteroid isomerase-like protein